MGDTFSVDIQKLGQIPDLLEGEQRWLASQRCAETGLAAAGAAGPGGNASVATFALSLDRYLAAGARALASDIAALDTNRVAYERTDLGVAGAFGRIG